MNMLTPPRWPVIAVIIIGGLIIISIIWCIARCLCCGLSCCCKCCYCLKCCGNCCGCCDTPKGHRQKYLDEPYAAPNQGYRSEPAMTAGNIAPSRTDTKSANPPQYAQFASFDTSKKEEGDDSLPAMPTWGDSESKKVMLEEEEVELQQLNKPGANGQNQPPANGMSPSPTAGGPGGMSPYGPQGNQAAASGYMGPGPGTPGMPQGPGMMGDPYGGQQGQGYNQMHNGYAQSQASFHTEQSWGVTGAQDYGQMPLPGHSPLGYDQQDYMESPGHAPGYFDPTSYSEYGGNATGPVQPPMDQPYGMGAEPQQIQQPQPQRRGPPRGAKGAVGGMEGASMPDRSHGSPAPQQQQLPQAEPAFSGGQFDAAPLTYSPAPTQGSFPAAPERTFSPAPPQRTFSPAPQRSFSPAPQRTFSPGPQRTFSPAPQRQFSADSAPLPGGRGPPMGGRGPPGRGPPGRGPPRGPPNRQFSADSAPNPQRQFSGDSAGRPLVGGLAGRPPPRRQYTADMAPPPGSPGPQNNAGFDFQSGVSRPPARANTFDVAGGGGNDQSEQSGAYPGYKPYQPGR